MKTYNQIFSIIIISFLVINFTISSPNPTGSLPPQPQPDQFIAEMFPNSTLPLQLTHTSTIMIINATDFSNKIGINFDANYTIYNPENTTIISVIVPFSLAIDIANATFEVHANDTQIPYYLFSVSLWNENITEIDIYFLPRSIDIYPITLIRSNVTLFKNSTSVIRYHLSGSMSNPLDSRDLFYITYYLGTSQEWIGNVTGRIELRVYGKQPVFSTGGLNVLDYPRQIVDINGGRSLLCEWNNIPISRGNIGVIYYVELSPFEEFMRFMALNLLIYIVITILIILWVIIRKKRKKIESQLFNVKRVSHKLGSFSSTFKTR